MSWNYRVMRSTDPDGTFVFTIREVYYDATGAVEAWTTNASWPQGETFGELTNDFAAYQGAFGRPVIAEIDCDLYEIGLGSLGQARDPKLVYRAAPAAD